MKLLKINENIGPLDIQEMSAMSSGGIQGGLLRGPKRSESVFEEREIDQNAPTVRAPVQKRPESMPTAQGMEFQPPPEGENNRQRKIRIEKENEILQSLPLDDKYMRLYQRNAKWMGVKNIFAPDLANKMHKLLQDTRNDLDSGDSKRAGQALKKAISALEPYFRHSGFLPKYVYRNALTPARKYGRDPMGYMIRDFVMEPDMFMRVYRDIVTKGIIDSER